VINGSLVDVIGQIGVDPGAQWGTSPNDTLDQTLRRNGQICAGDPNGSDPFDPATQWISFPADTFDGLGAHTAKCTQSCPADINGDQQVNVTDLLAVIGGWGACGNPCPADVNGDLQVNVTDLLAVIGAWGACANDDQDNDGWTIAEASELCNGIDDDCDKQVDEKFSDGAANTCANATYLGQLEGDGCGGALLTDLDSLAPAGDIDFFRARIIEVSSENQDLYARVILDVPPDAASAVRLCVTCISCGSNATMCIDVSPGQNGQLIFGADDEPFGGDDSFDLFIQVRSVQQAVSICQLYQLRVSCQPGTPQLLCN
jgi:hypothetical protein